MLQVIVIVTEVRVKQHGCKLIISLSRHQDTSEIGCHPELQLATLTLLKGMPYSGMREVVPARTSPTLHPPFPPTVHQLLRLAL